MNPAFCTTPGESNYRFTKRQLNWLATAIICKDVMPEGAGIQPVVCAEGKLWDETPQKACGVVLFSMVSVGRLRILAARVPSTRAPQGTGLQQQHDALQHF